MTITEKVSYVRGLAEGLDLDQDKKEVRLLSAIIDLLDDMALTVSDLEEGYNDISDQVDAVDEDLYSLEQDFYEDGEEDEEDFFYEVTCPTCNETICLSEDVLLKGEMDCPNCGETLEFDFDNICSEGCECHHAESCDMKDSDE